MRRITFCIDTTFFIGERLFIKNECEEESGEMVLFEVDTLNHCIIYTGIEEGQNRACIITCDDAGICDTTTIIVTVEPIPDTIPIPVAVDDRDTLKAGATRTINVLGNDTIHSPLIMVNILDAPENGIAIVNPDGTISYTAADSPCNFDDLFTYELCNPVGCDTATVYLYITCKVFLIYNGFSPNYDGVNDTFMIEGIEDYPNNQLQVLNRWGNIVCEQSGYKGQWDGTWKNKKLPDGTYLYILSDGQGKEYRGFLQIQR